MFRADPIRAQKTEIRRSIREDSANQLVELAVVLPILLVLVVGIFDFGQAFTLKQQLNTIAREGARLGSSQPTADLSQNTPSSVEAIRDLIDSDLKASGINDCGLGNTTSGGSITRIGAADQYKWQATGATCPTGITITIERQASILNTSSINMICTHVNVQYPFQWRFNKVVQLIAPGASGPSTLIPGDAIVPNMD